MRKLMTAVTLAALSGFGQGALAAADKVTICHNGQTLSIAASAVSAHMQHGDVKGACVAAPPVPPANTMAAVVMMRCEPQGASGVLVVSASRSPAPADPADAIAVNDDCAAVLGDLLDAGYELRSVTTGSAGDAVLHLYTDYLLIGRVPASP
jgi:hypothetical protein